MSRAKKSAAKKMQQRPFLSLRVIIAVFCIITVSGFALWAWLIDLPLKTAGFISDKTVAMGFSIHDVTVMGRKQIDRDELLEALAVNRGDPMLSFDPDAAARRIQTLNWASQVRIERHWPDKIIVRLTERTPLALWQRNQKLSLIDAEGQLLATPDLAPFQQLPVLVGDEAPGHAPELFKALLKYPDLYKQITALRWIGDRRWDIYLHNRIIVKMAEASEEFPIAQQLNLIKQLQDHQNLLARAITSVDLRVPDRVIVQTNSGLPQETTNPETGI